MDDLTKKRRKTMVDQLSTEADERLLKLEDEIINIRAQPESLLEKRKPPRKNTLSDLDAKLSTILGILAKVVVST